MFLLLFCVSHLFHVSVVFNTSVEDERGSREKKRLRHCFVWILNDSNDFLNANSFKVIVFALARLSVHSYWFNRSRFFFADEQSNEVKSLNVQASSDNDEINDFLIERIFFIHSFAAQILLLSTNQWNYLQFDYVLHQIISILFWKLFYFLLWNLPTHWIDFKQIKLKINKWFVNTNVFQLNAIRWGKVILFNQLYFFSLALSASVGSEHSRFQNVFF